MNVVSLFAGCGGLDLGFEQAGFNVVWANEFDQAIHPTYKLNHPNTKFCGDDIRTIKSEDIPDCDGIIGSPPCQSWSVGGRGKGFDDERGKLFLDYIRIVEDKHPKFFLIENVAGILEDKHKEAFTMFLDRLKKAGYDVSYSLLNTADYVIPQDRFRVFIVGTRKDLKVEYVFPESPGTPHVTLKRAIGDIIDSPEYSEGDIDTKISEHGFWNHDVYTGPYSSNYMHSNRVRSWDEVSFTIQAQASNAPQHPQAPKMPMSVSGGRMFKIGYEHLYRRLSVRECARIQSFPDSFHLIYDNVKDGYKMIGNAVPPRMGKYLAKQFLSLFNEGSTIKRKYNNSIKSIDIRELSKRYPNRITENQIITLDVSGLDISRNVLISLVKKDTISYYSKQDARIYYSGKKFPSTVALNKLYYFMPYIKGKGIRDLYFIEIVRVGSKQEVHPECDDNDFRLVFELKFIKQLFNDYVPVNLNIWHTFTDTTLEKLIVLKDDIAESL